MNKGDSLGNRMKDYENVNRNYLTKRTPVIVRVDGRAFHTLTRKCEKPFDNRLIKAMVEAATRVAQDMQGFKLAYVQSDEASFLITDYNDVRTQGWFNYNLSKIISLSSSIMSVHFNNNFNYGNFGYFDSRAFNIPEKDIANYFLWRSNDWSRNSLQMFAQANFSHKQLEGKKREDMHEMLHGIGKNWATDLSPQERNGTFFRKETFSMEYLRDIKPNYEEIKGIVEQVLADPI